MLLGTVLGLASGLAWALVTTTIRPLLSRAGLGAIATTRLGIGAVIFLLVALVSGHLPDAAGMSFQLYLLIFISASASLIVGDNAYFMATRYIGVAKAFPISMTYPLWTALVAISFLGERAGWLFWVGALLTIAGTTLLVLPSAAKPSDGPLPASPKWQAIAVGLSLLAAFAWTSSAVVLKVVLTQADPITTAAVRTTFAALVAAGLALSSRRFAGAWPRGRWLLLSLGLGVGTVASFMLYVLAINEVGAARSSVLNGTAPLFAAPIAYFVLRERITARTWAGIIATVVGVMLVV